MKNKNYLILSGGTGGHVIPAVNFGNYIIEKGYNCILFVDKRGEKYTKSFKGKIRIISSSHFTHNFFGKIKAIILLLIGFFQSFKYLIDFRPSISISFGSYATFMPLVVLIIFRFFGLTRIYLHEQNSVMGKVNLFFSPFANKIFLNFKKTFKLKDNSIRKTFHVGFPCNDNIQIKKRNTDTYANKYIRLLICGGSQGAISLNKIVLDLFYKFPKNLLNQIQVTIQCPNIQKKEVKASLDKLSIKYELNNFFENFFQKLYENEVLITRSGAGTVNDVILTQIPTIFVPLPFSSNNHQFYNANYLKQKNAAYIIEQNNLNSESSLHTIIKLISNMTQQNNLIKNLQKIKSFDTNYLIFQHLND